MKVFELLKKRNISCENNVVVSNGRINYSLEEIFKYTEIISLELEKYKIQKNDVIALVSSSNPLVVSIILAILKNNAVYLPINNDLPKERKQQIYHMCGVRLVICLENNTSINNFTKCISEINCIKKINSEMPQIIYIIFTSGSSGSPKAIMIREDNVINLINGLYTIIYSNYKNKENVALISPLYFDSSIKNLFMSIYMGFSLFLVDAEFKKNPRKLLNFYNINKITITDGTPGLIELLIKSALCFKTKLYIKHFLLGGEILPKKLLNEIFSINEFENVLITNLYGPTECTVDSTYYNIQKNTVIETIDVPLGYPMPNCNIYIVDSNNKIVEKNVLGEIFITGDCVGEGYVGENYSNNYLNNIFDNKSKKMYKTGDLGFLDKNGLIHFYGRKEDSQIKINGYRIDLIEIERNILSILSKDAKIKVLVFKNKFNISTLVCVIETTNQIDCNYLRKELEKKLPNYMIPKKFLFLEKMPLNSNGKIDKSKLNKVIEKKDY